MLLVTAIWFDYRPFSRHEIIDTAFLGCSGHSMPWLVVTQPNDAAIMALACRNTNSGPSAVESSFPRQTRSVSYSRLRQ